MDLLQGLDGSDTLNGRAGNDVLEGGAGSDTLNGGLGDDVLYGNNAGNTGYDYGYDSLSDDQGGNDQLFGQDGNDYLAISRYDYNSSVPASVVSLDGGSGDDTIRFNAYGRFVDTVTIKGGTGNDDILVGSVLKSSTDAGDGNDKVTIGMSGGNQTITLGAGADTLTLLGDSYTFAIGNPTRITDFVNGTDTLGMDQYLANVLINWNKATNPFADGHLKLVQSGSDTLLQLDRDGASGMGYGFSTLLTFANTSATAFTARDLGYAPDGSNAIGQTIVGTSGNDTLVGSEGADLIQGLDGNDTLNGRAGNDVIEGGLGGDTLSGGLGDDILYGNNANNTGYDYSFDNLSDDEGGNDQLFGQDGSDFLSVSRYDFNSATAASTVLLDGGSGDDIIRFNAYSRFIDTVTIKGDTGNDDIVVGSVLKSTIDAGEGNDKVTISTSGKDQTITLGTGSDILMLEGDSYNFTVGNPIRITDFANGTDALFMDQYLLNVLTNWDRSTNPFADGHFKLIQSGSDAVLQLDRDGASGASYGLATLLTFAYTSVSAFTACDLGYASNGSAGLGQTIVGTSDSDTLIGADGADRLQGLGGGDTLIGRAGNDVLEGGSGSDTLNGGLGDDILYGNNAGNTGSDFYYDNLTDDQGGNDQLFGQDGTDYLFVSRYDNNGTTPASTVLLDGGSGDDTIYFSAFGRFLDTVTIRGGTGADDIRVGSVLKSTVDAGDGNDKISIGLSGGNQTITLGAGSDVLTLEGDGYSFAVGNPTRVTDFATGTDTLNMDQYLANVLIDWNKSTNPFADGHLKLVQSGGDTLLQIDRDGASGTSYGFSTLLTFASTSATAFTAKDLGYAPVGHAAVADMHVADMTLHQFIIV